MHRPFSRAMIAVSPVADIQTWEISDQPKIVVWEASMIVSSANMVPLLDFWLAHGARTFVFGGRYGYRVEDAVIERIQTLETEGGFNELVLTSKSQTLPGAVWRGGFTGYVDTPNGEEPIVCIMRVGSVSKLREVKDWVQGFRSGWIPDD